MFNKWKMDEEIANQCRIKIKYFFLKIGNKGQLIAVDRKILLQGLVNLTSVLYLWLLLNEHSKIVSRL